MRILIVEDEMMIAMLLEGILIELGHEVLGPVTRLVEAVDAAARGEMDAAIVDLNLGGEWAYPVAEALVKRGIPLAFSTGYGVDALLDEWRERPTLPKPFCQADVEKTLKTLEEIGAASPTATPPGVAADDRRRTPPDSEYDRADGLRHELKNLLTVISGNLEMLEMKAAVELRPLIVQAREAADLAARLSSRVGFSDLALETRAVDINTVIKRAKNALARISGPAIQITMRLAKAIPPARANERALETLLAEIAADARIGMGSGGRLVFRSRLARVEEAGESLWGGSFGRRIVLSVSAIACDDEMRQRLLARYVGQGRDRGAAPVKCGAEIRVRDGAGDTVVVELVFAPAESLAS